MSVKTPHFVIIFSNDPIKVLSNLILAQALHNYWQICWISIDFDSLHQPTPDALAQIRLCLQSSGALNGSLGVRWMKEKSAYWRRRTSHLPLTRVEPKPDPPVRLELRWLKYNLWCDNGDANMPIKMKIKHRKAIVGVCQNKKIIQAWALSVMDSVITLNIHIN